MKGLEMQGNPEEKSAATNNTDSVDWKAQAELAEQRRRDTQAAFTKSRQELAATKAELKVLKETGGHSALINPTKKQELEDLKFSDPDAWRAELDALEAAARTELSGKIASEVNKLSELEIRQAKLEEFKANHPGFELSDDDIPLRLSRKLAEGQISFDEFLQEAYTFVVTPKVIGGTAEVLGQPDLSKVGGGITPSQAAKSKDIIASYRNEVY